MTSFIAAAALEVNFILDRRLLLNVSQLTSGSLAQRMTGNKGGVLNVRIDFLFYTKLDFLTAVDFNLIIQRVIFH